MEAIKTSAASARPGMVGSLIRRNGCGGEMRSSDGIKSAAEDQPTRTCQEAADDGIRNEANETAEAERPDKVGADADEKCCRRDGGNDGC